MNILLVLIPLSLVCSTIGLVAFVWAVNRGQFDDVDEQAKVVHLESGGKDE